MASSNGATTFRQDMPPPGGYKPIPYIRIPARRIYNARALVVGFFAVTFGACYLYIQNARKTIRLETEHNGARIALHPMILAERDRAYLTQLRKNRDEEERLMANVPGWVVGTYYGTQIYHTRPKDEWQDVTIGELFCHADPWYLDHHTQFHKWR